MQVINAVEDLDRGKEPCSLKTFWVLKELKECRNWMYKMSIQLVVKDAPVQRGWYIGKFTPLLTVYIHMWSYVYVLYFIVLYHRCTLVSTDSSAARAHPRQDQGAQRHTSEDGIRWCLPHLQSPHEVHWICIHSATWLMDVQQNAQIGSKSKLAC